jgi:hypothetical protein
MGKTYVYAVDNGDGDLRGIFSTREAAEAIRAECDKITPKEHYMVQVIELDELVGARTMPIHQVAIGLESGTIDDNGPVLELVGREPIRDTAGPYQGWDGREATFVCDSSVSLEDAMALARARRAEWLATAAH